MGFAWQALVLAETDPVRSYLLLFATLTPPRTAHGPRPGSTVEPCLHPNPNPNPNPCDHWGTRSDPRQEEKHKSAANCKNKRQEITEGPDKNTPDLYEHNQYFIFLEGKENLVFIFEARGGVNLDTT